MPHGAKRLSRGTGGAAGIDLKRDYDSLEIRELHSAAHGISIHRKQDRVEDLALEYPI